MNKPILILGGYGNTGRLIARLLLQETNGDIIIAGRSLARARALAERLNEEVPGDRVQAAFADAAQPETLLKALHDASMLVVASGTAEFTRQVAGAALDAGVDYFDVIYSGHKLALLREMEPQIVASGRLFITDGGFHPGLPAALVRYIAPCFDQLLEARVGSVIKIDWANLQFSPSTMREFAAEFVDFQTLVYDNGRWQQTSMLRMMKPETMEFGAPFGRQYAVPMFLEEMRDLPRQFPELRETGFYVGGFNPVTDWLISPLVMAGLKVAPRRGLAPLGRLFTWSLRAFSRPPYGTMLKLEARGRKHGKWRAIDLTIAHDDGYFLTAVPAVACLLQVLDGPPARTGLHFQAHFVEPERFMRDMERMGIAVRQEALLQESEIRAQEGANDQANDDGQRDAHQAFEEE